MSKRFDLLVFDWDGTLSDSTAVIVNAILQAFAEVGLTQPSRAEAAFVIGYELQKAFSYLAPSADGAMQASLIAAYKRAYLSRDGEITLFAGVADALARYHAAGKSLAVATGKSRKGLDRALAQSGLGQYFEITRCADECFSKPHPQMLQEILASTGISAERAVMVGDTTHDLQMASNAGVAALGVAYGAHPHVELKSLAPLAIFEEFAQLDAWLHQHA